MSTNKLTDNWFFANPPKLLRLCLIYVWGDALILLPLSIAIAVICIFNLKLGLILVGSYIATRSFGEMMYWFFQQAGNRTYRPYDFGQSQLSNHAVYILYQTWNNALVILGVGITVYTVFYIN